MKHGKSIDMTSGNIARQLLVYAIPILMGELFQQLYNTADAIILGNYVSSQAMAAVGGTSVVTKMLVGFFNGVSIGCTVVVARSFGEKNVEKLRCSIHTIVYMTFFLGILLAVVGVLITRPILEVQSTPPNVLPLAETYVTIYFIGLPGLVMYNTFTGILRAVGDARRPFYFLVFSSVLNILLDILLAVVFKWGVAGVAIATILAQALSAFLCLFLLLRTKEDYRFRFRGDSLSWEVVLQVMRIGIPTGIQKTLTAFSNVVVLSYVNFFGDACLAGWVVYTKVNHFVVVGLQSMGSSVTTFASQNLGAKQYQRAKTGVRYAYWVSIIFTVIMSLAILVFCDPIARLFGDDAEALSFAQLFISQLIMLQLVHVAQSIYAGALRGMGHATSATIILLSSLIGIRQIYLSCVTKIVNTPLVVGLSFPIGWLISGLLMYGVYRRNIERAIHRLEDV